MSDQASGNAVANGESLLHYRILAKLGQGGMGEVYEAEDLRLNRNVAIKVLPPSVSSDPSRRQRFEREAKAVAALNHPNIVTLHSVEEAAGRLFIVMELVQGSTLAKRILPGGLPRELFFEWAMALAEAVGTAHQRGIVHRDLKPQNVMIGRDGRLKVLDFGLAKIEASSGDDLKNAPTATLLSMEGAVVGTIPYMSPEQAQGEQVDHRTDVFSLGIILFEMATGVHPFRGSSHMGLMTAIIRDPPANLEALNPAVPAGLRRLIERCLEKSPARRYQSLLDLRSDLEDLRDAAPAPQARLWRSLPSLRRWGPALALAGVVVAAGGAGYALRSARGGAASSTPLPASNRPSIERFTQATTDEGPELSPSLSPDGNWLVYASRRTGNWDLYRMRVGGEIPMNLTADSKDDDTDPAISPDGEWIAFRSERLGGGIFVMGATGESARRVADFGYTPTWAPDGTELLVTTEQVGDPRHRPRLGTEVWAIRVDTGQRRKLTEGDALHAVVSPHGHRIAYWGVHNGGVRDLWTAPFKEAGAPVLLTNDAAIDWNPVWSPSGDAIYFASDRGGVMNLWRIPVDERTGVALGPPEAVTHGVAGWIYGPSFSRDGHRMAFVSPGPRRWVERVRLDTQRGVLSGEPARVAMGDTARSVGDMVVFQPAGQSEDLAVVGPEGTGRRKLTDDVFRDRMPRGSPDGQRIAFLSDRGGAFDFWSIGLDGSGLTQLTDVGQLVFPSWSPDGKRMAGCRNGKDSFVFDPHRPWKEQTPEELPPLPEPELSFCATDWSPDGRMLVGFAIGPVGFTAGIWIYSFETRTYRRFNTPTGVTHGVWLKDSRRVLYVHGQSALAILDTESTRSQTLLSLAPDLVSHCSVTRDDQWVYFSHYAVDGDIWVATLR